MPRKSAWSSTPGGGGQRFELEPPGFVAFYKLALWGLVFGGAMVLPLSLTGIFGALVFDDFEVALRIGMSVAGTGCSAGMIWLVTRILVGATSLRSRVTVTPAGVLVETGVTSARERIWLTPLDAVSADKPKSDELARGGVVLTAGDASIRVAIGYHERDRSLLLKAVQAALEGTDGDPGEAPAARPPGPPWADRARRLGRDIATPLRHPTPYLFGRPGRDPRHLGADMGARRSHRLARRVPHRVLPVHHRAGRASAPTAPTAPTLPDSESISVTTTLGACGTCWPASASPSRARGP